MSVLIINDVPVECINKAAIDFHVPATLIISILRTENGRVGDALVNRNGTIDYGPMQINSIWLDKISPYGYTRESIQYDPCANVEVGTWILAQKITSGDSFWQGVGNYHSAEVYKNVTYGYKVKNFYADLINYLNTGKVGKLKKHLS